MTPKAAMRRHIGKLHADILSEKGGESNGGGDSTPKPSKKPKRVILGSSPKEDPSGEVEKVISRNKAIIEEAEKAQEVNRKSPKSPTSEDSTAEELDEFECSDKNALGFNNFISKPNPGKSLFACPYCWYKFA